MFGFMPRSELDLRELLRYINQSNAESLEFGGSFTMGKSYFVVMISYEADVLHRFHQHKSVHRRNRLHRPPNLWLVLDLAFVKCV